MTKPLPPKNSSIVNFPLMILIVLNLLVYSVAILLYAQNRQLESKLSFKSNPPASSFIPTVNQQDSEAEFEWAKIKSGEATLDFGDKNKFGFIKLDKSGLWLMNEDGSGAFELHNQAFVSAAISPNGNYIAFLKGAGELMVQKIRGIGSLKPTKLTNIFRPNEGETKGVNTRLFAWSPDSTKIAFDAAYYPQVDADYVPKEHIEPEGVIEGIYYVDLAKPEEALLLYAYPIRPDTYEIETRILGWTPDSKEVILQEGYSLPDIKINIFTQKKSVFQVGDIGQYSWNGVNDKIAYFDYQTNQIILDNHGIKTVLAESQKILDTQINLAQSPQFSPDGNYVLYHNSNYGENKEEIWLVDITQPKYPKTLITTTGLNQLWYGSGFWFSDSKTILYGINGTDNVKGFDIDLYIVSLDNKTPKEIAAGAYKPAVSTTHTGLNN